MTNSICRPPQKFTFRLLNPNLILEIPRPEILIGIQQHKENIHRLVHSVILNTMHPVDQSIAMPLRMNVSISSEIITFALTVLAKIT